MSAELLIYHVIMFGHDSNEEDTNDRKRRMLHELNHITQKDIDEYKTNLENLGYEDDENENFTELIKFAINDFFKCLDGSETEYKWIGNETIWITGGMSWGDDPTNACNMFEEFNALPHKIKMAGGFK